MRGASSHRRSWAARIVLTLALFAAVGRAAIPVGFMPTAREGVLQVIICGAEGAAHTLLDLGGDEPAPASGGGDHCVFAVASAAAAPVAGASVAAPFAVGHFQSSALTPDLAPGRGLAAPPPPSHAPPVLT